MNKNTTLLNKEYDFESMIDMEFDIGNALEDFPPNVEEDYQRQWFGRTPKGFLKLTLEYVENEEGESDDE